MGQDLVEPTVRQLTWTGIDITGLMDLEFSGSFAKLNVFGAGEFDIDHLDFLRVEAQIDGSGYQTILIFRGSTTDSLFFENNGDINGAFLTDTAQLFTRAISGTGDLLDLRLTTSVDDIGEDFAIDDLTISGISTVGRGLTDEALVTVTIDGVNDAPIAQDDAVTTDEDSMLSGNVLVDNGHGADSDVDSDTLTVTQVNGLGANVGSQITLASGALLILTTDGSFHYDPNGQFDFLVEGDLSEDIFTYTVTDGHEAATATVTITINGTVPIANAAAFTTEEDIALSGTLTGTDPDDLTFTLVPGSEVGGELTSLDADTGAFTFTPTADFFGTASFDFEVRDGSEESAPATITIYVTPIKDAPIAQDDAVTTDEDSMLSGNVLVDNGHGADSDVDSDTLTVTQVNGLGANVGSQITLASGALLTLNADGTFHYDPNGQFEDLGVGERGTDMFRYTVSDGEPAGQVVTAFSETFDDASQFTITLGSFFSDGRLSYFGLYDGAGGGDFGSDPVPPLGDSTYFGFDGSYLVGQDLVEPTVRQLTWTGIDITGLMDLEFSGSFAESNVFGAGEFDIDHLDFLRVEAQIDGSGYQTILIFRGSTTDSLFFENNGDINGAFLTDTAQLFTRAISGTGDLLDLRLTTSVDDIGEDFAIDDLTISGISTGGRGLTDEALVTVTIDGVNDAPVLMGTGPVLLYVENSLPTSITFGSGGGEFLINETTAGIQFDPSVDALKGGGFVVTWTSNSGTESDILGQIFDAARNPVGDEFTVNTATTGDQIDASVAGLVDGRFIAAWTSLNGTEEGVRAQIFDATGSRLGDEFSIDTGSAFSEPSVTTLEGGGFVITWIDAVGEVRAQIFDETGQPVGNSLFVTSYIFDPGEKFAPSVTGLSGGPFDGGFVITWDEQGDIKARIYTAGGEAFGGPYAGNPFLVNTTTSGDQINAGVTGLANGEFVVVWNNGSQVRGQIFDAFGFPVGDEFSISATLNSFSSASVSTFSDGSFVVTYPVGDEIRGQIFDATGQAVGEEFLVASTTGDYQSASSVTVLEGGTFVVAWGGNDLSEVNQLDYEIRGQMFGAATITDPDNTSIESATITLTGFVLGEDVLSFTDQNGIAGSYTYDEQTSTLTLILTGSASLADYGSALRSVTYQNTSDDPATVPRQISFTVNDGVYDSNTVTRQINVIPVNDAPMGSPAADLSNGNEDEPYTVTVGQLLNGFTDLEHDTLSVSNLIASNGSIAFDGDQTYTITPEENFNGTMTLTYNVSDGNGGVLTGQTQSYTVNPVSDAPVLVTTALIGGENQIVAGPLVAIDGDGDALTFSLTGNGPDDAQFGIDPASGFLLPLALDYENPT